MGILIIEPEVSRLRRLLSILGIKPVDIASVPDPKSGLLLLGTQRFELCFLSMDGSDYDARGVLRQVRDALATSSLPVIGISQDASRETVLGAIRAGASSFLAHPFSIADVELAISHASS